MHLFTYPLARCNSLPKCISGVQVVHFVRHGEGEQPVKLLANSTTVFQQPLQIASAAALTLLTMAAGYHNVAGHADEKNYLSDKYFDAHLTPFGWQQVITDIE